LAGSKKLLSAGREFRLGRLDHVSSGSRWGSIIDRRSFCASNQAVLYVMPSCDANWSADMPFDVGCHEMRGPEPHCQRQFGPVHHWYQP